MMSNVTRWSAGFPKSSHTYPTPLFIQDREQICALGAQTLVWTVAVLMYKQSICRCIDHMHKLIITAVY